MDNLRQKAGYVDVKLPPKSRGLHKVKPWKRRWVVVRQMSDLAARQTVARVDIYLDEEAASSPHSEKTTVLLENITAVRRTKSRTHPYAFEIVDTEVRLSLSGYSEGDTQGWIILLRHILFSRRSTSGPPPEAVEVSLIDNRDSHRLQLSGNFWLSVTPTALSLRDPVDCEVTQAWRLNSLRSFHLATTRDDRDKDQILVIQAGPMADTGQGEYLFFSPRAREILEQIKTCIQQALAMRQAAHAKHSGHRQRTCSTTSSVLNYRTLLDRHESGLTVDIHREDDSPVEEQSLQLTIPKHVLVTRSTSLPRDMVGLSRQNSSFSPPKHVLEAHPRRLTTGEISPEDIIDIGPVRPSRSMESLPQNVSPPVTNLILDMAQASTDPTGTEEVRRDKGRTVSVSSNVSRASGSITSRDSGIMFGMDNKTQIEEGFLPDHVIRDTSNSFDSAVSTSGPVDEQKTRATTLATETLHPSENIADRLSNHNETTDEPEARVKKISVESNIYADIPSRKTSTVSNDYAAIPADEVDRVSEPVAGKLHRSYSADRFMGENDYEELDSFRKDLKKHLGFNPGVNSTDEPPALPERPSSTKVVRRQKQTSRKVRASKVASMFVRPSRKSSTCSSSSDEEDVNNLISQIRNWPFDKQSSVTDDNNLYNSEPVIYDEITKSYERLDNIVPAVQVAVTDQLVPSDLFDMISPPPVSCQLGSWGNVDLLTSSPTRLSPVPGLKTPTLTPTRDVFDASWTPVSGSPSRPSLLVDIPERSATRRRSSTLSCPCQDERCRHTVSGDEEEEDNGRAISRSFSEVSEHLSSQGRDPLLNLETNDTYECMSGTSPNTRRAGRDELQDNWANFSNSFGSSDDQQNTWADFSVFEGLGCPNGQDIPGNKSQTQPGLSAAGFTPNHPSVSKAVTEVVNLIDWDIVVPETEADSTYMDMSSPKR